ncbi:hypothetical protein C491_05986 [Natronococcus amylolyticus DSM 10524]|uniref:Uncharacterized protein n=1 Tax=Natronococcus amylolyticus DSM 10524 TaxID=1227497 RepID=L9XDU7_9EURY|nr:DUF5781 family protein [Natronococcus amylolyticus]ELY59895.1 hypothetical protein C491_05986 [Natronococcus amylolyticus DSM 10524]
MDIRVTGSGPTTPFLGARDLFETEYDLSLPVDVELRDDPDVRTWAGHYDDRHVLNISRQAASSAMARELALHEFAHMARYEQSHPSHTQSTEEVLYLALAGKSVERRKLSHCYQIANHMKDIYADDITLSVGPGEKLLSFLESSLAAAVVDRPQTTPQTGRTRLSAIADPEITAVNAAFALALAERHDLVESDHRLYDLAHVAAVDAPDVPFHAFKRRFRELTRDPDSSSYRQVLVDATRAYVGEEDSGSET